MPSPFPGMDPYIESSGVWGDFHISMIAAMRAALNGVLPARYAASADVHVWSVDPDTEASVLLGKPHVPVTAEEGATGGVATRVRHARAPANLRLRLRRRRSRRYLRIAEARTNRVVTVIELLSPSNKAAGPDRQAYLAKREEYLATGTNLVEIDLLRGGPRLPLGDSPPVSAYYFLVCRTWEVPEAGCWPIELQDALPDIPVPLVEDEPDVPLPVQKCVRECYDTGRYSMKLRYAEPLSPPPDESDAAWVREVLASRTKPNRKRNPS
jgi:Protein of unknown function (DUF4058)